MRGDRTALMESYHSGAFHLSKPYWDGRTLQLWMVNPTAGMLSGDRLTVDVHVDPGASLRLSSPSHSRAFRSPLGWVETQQTLTLAANSWLDWCPEPLVPHAGSDYRQHTQVHLEPGAGLLWIDGFGSGRAARGENWAWQHLRLDVELNQSGRRLLCERQSIDPQRLGRQTTRLGLSAAWFATVVWIPAVRPDAATTEVLCTDLHGLHQPPRQWIGCSHLPRTAGLWMRLIAADGQQLRDLITAVRTRLQRIDPRIEPELRKG